LNEKQKPLGYRTGYSVSGGGFIAIHYYFDDEDNLVGIEIYHDSQEVTVRGEDKLFDDLPDKVKKQLETMCRGLPLPNLLTILPTGFYVSYLKTETWETIKRSEEYKVVVAALMNLSELICGLLPPR